MSHAVEKLRKNLVDVALLAHHFGSSSGSEQKSRRCGRCAFEGSRDCETVGELLLQSLLVAAGGKEKQRFPALHGRGDADFHGPRVSCMEKVGFGRLRRAFVLLTLSRIVFV
jgi:hypothetical protein